MSPPLDFLGFFREQLAGAGVRFALTSGMACVHYGLQQTTKDSDWIIEPADLKALRGVLSAIEASSPPLRVSYRRICGAALDARFLGCGWTSHLLVTEAADGREQHVDLFGKAPRVSRVETDAAGWATREVVAMMKRTDRPRDWPIVDGLGWQMEHEAPGRGLVHIQDGELLLRAWQRADAETRLARRSPAARC